MAIEIGIWRLGKQLQRLASSSLVLESKLEDTLAQDISVLAPGFMLIGRQVPTNHGKFIDILALGSDGKVTVVELKRDKTPREVVAQLLDYASWVQDLSYEDIASIYSSNHDGKKLEEGFADAFGGSAPEEINQEHELLIVATELDAATERIIGYLTDNYGVPLNAVFFRCFKDGDNEYMARSWLIDPEEAEVKSTKAPTKKGREAWNGKDFYVSIGEGPTRTWNDCRKYGFISGGGGKWYSQTLKNLFPGARVFVNVPGTGYVGAGVVKETAVHVRDFHVERDGKSCPVLSLPLEASGMDANSDDPDASEYLVKVEWLKAVPKEQAYWEKGLFAIQHTACKLRNRFTIDRLTQHFGLQDA